MPEFQTLMPADAPTLATAILKQDQPYKLFLSFLGQQGNPEDPIPLFSATFLVNLISVSLTSSPKPAPRDDEALPQLFTYLSKLVKNPDSGLQDIGVQHTSQLLRTARSKELFWKQRDDTVDPLFDILRKAIGTTKDNDSTLWNGGSSIRSSDTRFGGGVGLQLMYHVLLVIWQLSFEAELVGSDLEKYVVHHVSHTCTHPRAGSKRLSRSTHNCYVSHPKRRLPDYCWRRSTTSLPPTRARSSRRQRQLDSRRSWEICLVAT